MTIDPQHVSGRPPTHRTGAVAQLPTAPPVPAASLRAQRYPGPAYRPQPVRSPAFRHVPLRARLLAGRSAAWVAPPEPEDSARRFDPFAVAALTTALLWLFLPAIVLGHVARRRLRTSGDGGDGIAIMALVLGYAVLALAVGAFVVTEMPGGVVGG